MDAYPTRRCSLSYTSPDLLGAFVTQVEYTQTSSPLVVVRLESVISKSIKLLLSLLLLSKYQIIMSAISLHYVLYNCTHIIFR